MNAEAGKHIGGGIAWLGFWLMIGLANFGEEPIAAVIDGAVTATTEVVSDNGKNED